MAVKESGVCPMCRRGHSRVRGSPAGTAMSKWPNGGGAGLEWVVVSTTVTHSSSSYEFQYALHMRSINIMHCFVWFGGVCAATSTF